MELTDSVAIMADRQTVWDALNDPQVLAQTIPGCEAVEQISETHLAATLRLKIGPIKARFAGDVTLSDIRPAEGYVLTGEGKGGVAGFAKGAAKVRIEDGADGGVILHYDVTADVGGRIAQLGARLLLSTAKKLSKQFFEAFRAVVETETETVQEEVA